MKKLIQNLLVSLSLVTLLTACGGGGENQESSGNDGSNTSVKFSVELSGLHVRRVSNGDAVSVDLSSINSGELIFNQ